MDRITKDRVSVIASKELLLNDKGIKDAVGAEQIIIYPKPTDDQFQPATLDVRIGTVRIYDAAAMEKTARRYSSLSFREIFNLDCPTNEYARMILDGSDTLIDVPSKSFLEVFFHETITWAKTKYYLTCDLRSSRGRLGFSLEKMRIEYDREGLYISVFNNNPNAIRLYGQDKFAQLFFHAKNESVPHNGYVVDNPNEAKEIANKMCEGDFEMLGPYIIFKLGNHIMKFKKDIGTIDTKKKYSNDELYDFFDTKDSVSLQMGDSVVAQLLPKLNLPANVGISLLHNIPYFQMPGLFGCDSSVISLEHRAANAGWVDPGYSGNITAHPMQMKRNTVLKKGDTIALGKIIKYYDDSSRSYGSSDLKSHYQNSNGVASRS